MLMENQNNFDENNNELNNLDINRNKENNNNEITSNENNKKSEVYNKAINPHLDRIKQLKENLKAKLGLENSLLNLSNKDFDGEKHLSKFSSGAVEYGLPCEVIHNRGLEVII